MDQSAFYGVMSAINFTLLGLWWVAVKDRIDLGDGSTSFQRMAYFVSLQFAIPATVALLAQVAPTTPQVWRTSFALAGIVGVVGVLMLTYELSRHSDPMVLAKVFAVLSVPIYALVVIVALSPKVVADAGFSLAPIEAEGLMLAILAFLGVQEAWFIHMTPSRTDDV